MTNGAGGLVSFESMTYQVVGTYEYTITETGNWHQGQSDDTIRYDGSTEYITVTVSDLGDGNLSAQVSYDANGTEIRSGSYEIDLSTADGWKKGTFKTTEGATLFPYEINAGGRYVTDFQIYSISDSHMVLTYPDNGAFSGWSEGTYWAFKKK